MAILLDSSAVLAAADQSDLNHRAALAWFGRVDEPLMIGALTLAELDLLLQRELGLRATFALLASIGSGGDQGRSADHRGLDPRHRVDARDDRVPAAADRRRSRGTAERLGVTRVAVFDRPPIAIFRPKHVRALDLEP